MAKIKITSFRLQTVIFSDRINRINRIYRICLPVYPADPNPDLFKIPQVATYMANPKL